MTCRAQPPHRITDHAVIHVVVISQLCRHRLAEYLLHKVPTINAVFLTFVHLQDVQNNMVKFIIGSWHGSLLPSKIMIFNNARRGLIFNSGTQAHGGPPVRSAFIAEKSG